MNYDKMDNVGCEELRKYLISIGDENYKKFHSKIVKETNYKIIGVRMPELRKISKSILKGDTYGFMNSCGNEYYEEIMLLGLVTAQIKTDYDEAVKNADSFITKIDNWAICDTFCSSFKSIRGFMSEFFEHINEYLKSDNQWAVRAGIVLMMSHCLTDEYIDRVLHRLDTIQRSEYYVQMAKAWLLATVFAKYREKALNYINTAPIDDITFNMMIQKCVDSYRVSEQDKECLKGLRRKVRKNI